MHPREVTPALLQIGAILIRLNGPSALAEVSRFLCRSFPHYRWVGVYRREGETLILTGWEGEGPTEHHQIPLAQGLCGRAARENRTVTVDDVSRDPDYLVCFPDTRSEIVVPIHDAGTVLGEIDVDATRVKAFDASDARFLEMVATKLVPVLRAAAAPSATDSAASH